MSRDDETARLLLDRREELLQAGLRAVYAATPGLWERFGEAGRERFRENVGSHLDYLAVSLRLDASALFEYYLEWLDGLFIGLGMPPGFMLKTIDALHAGLSGAMPADRAAAVLAFTDNAKKSYHPEPSRIGAGRSIPLGEDAARFLQALLAGHRDDARTQILEKVRAGVPTISIYLDIFQATQYELGRRWHEGTISVAEEHFCTAATQAIMSQIQPLIHAEPGNGQRLVAAAVEGDPHEIGIRMISELLELAGWDSYFLGASTPPSSILAAVRGRQASLLCLSVTMPYHLISLEATILLVRDAYPAGEVKILVGGRPFIALPSLWKTIGADAFAPDAASALEYAASLVRVRTAERYEVKR